MSGAICSTTRARCTPTSASSKMTMRAEPWHRAGSGAGSLSATWRMDLARTFACRDDGESPDCPVDVRGESDEEVVRLAMEHGRQTHGMTAEQLRDAAV